MSTRPNHSRYVVCLVSICLLTGSAAMAGPDVPLERMTVGMFKLYEVVMTIFKPLALIAFTFGLLRIPKALLSSWKPNPKR